MPPLTPTQSEGFETELNRSTLPAIVLMILKNPSFSSEIMTKLEQMGVTAEANTVYPLIRRLQKQGLIDISLELENNRAKKKYHLTDAGASYLTDILELWRQRVEVIEKLIEDGGS